MIKEILVLSKYGNLGASSRLRMLQYVPFLERSKIKVTVHPLLSDKQLQNSYDNGGYELYDLFSVYAKRLRMLLGSHRFDVLWIEKEALPWCPLFVELAMLNSRPYVLDYDDAVFHSYDNHRSFWVRFFFGRRIDGLMSNAALVVCGNNYLAQRARAAGAPWVEVLPTVVDLVRYPISTSLKVNVELPRIVWIGSPSTIRYLRILCDPLAELARMQPYVLRVIGGGPFSIPGVHVEVLPWSEESEVDSISACQVGVMPLQDSPWERGKCGYKLIQYMACELPVVASFVGVNSEIVQHGQNGFLVKTQQEWVDSLRGLLSDSSQRLEMGCKGRLQVEEKYCIEQTGPRLVQFMHTVAEA
jgi:glycosyltransferase involved in cell wall biosynthesis